MIEFFPAIYNTCIDFFLNFIGLGNSFPSSIVILPFLSISDPPPYQYVTL